MRNILGHLVFYILIFYQLPFIVGNCQIQNKDSLFHVRIDGPGSHSLTQKNSPLFIITIGKKHLQLPQRDNFSDTTNLVDIDWLVPDLIKSLNILKGNEATSKYGLLGKNGVILIELKKSSFKKIPKRVRKNLLKKKIEL